jgi:hypothetical protein
MEYIYLQVSRRQTYYDYAKKKLEIAEKIGLIVPASPHKKSMLKPFSDYACLYLIKSEYYAYGFLTYYLRI